MSELLDIYDENGNHIGIEDRNVVHQKGLWHKTIHCWIVKDRNHILFQKRSSNLLDNPSKLYTTASGHIKAGESLHDAFAREVSEELGIAVPKPQKLFEQIYTTDFIKKNGMPYHDRAFCNVFVAFCDLPLSSYKPQEEELDGIVEVDIKEALSLFKGEIDKISASVFVKEDGKYEMSEKQLGLSDFLCNPTETHYHKYGRVLESILKL